MNRGALGDLGGLYLCPQKCYLVWVKRFAFALGLVCLSFACDRADTGGVGSTKSMSDSGGDLSNGATGGGGRGGSPGSVQGGNAGEESVGGSGGSVETGGVSCRPLDWDVVGILSECDCVVGSPTWDPDEVVLCNERDSCCKDPNLRYCDPIGPPPDPRTFVCQEKNLGFCCGDPDYPASGGCTCQGWGCFGEDSDYCSCGTGQIPGGGACNYDLSSPRYKRCCAGSGTWCDCDQSELPCPDGERAVRSCAMDEVVSCPAGKIRVSSCSSP